MAQCVLCGKMIQGVEYKLYEGDPFCPSCWDTFKPQDPIKEEDFFDDIADEPGK